MVSLGLHSWLLHRWLLHGWLLHTWLLHRRLLHSWLLHRWLLHGWLLHSWLLHRRLLHSWLLHRWLLHGWLLHSCLLHRWLLHRLDYRLLHARHHRLRRHWLQLHSSCLRWLHAHGLLQGRHCWLHARLRSHLYQLLHRLLDSL